jgi:hypothetical protein
MPGHLGDAPLILARVNQVIKCDRKFAHASARGVPDRIRDRTRRAGDADLADPLDAERIDSRRALSLRARQRLQLRRGQDLHACWCQRAGEPIARLSSGDSSWWLLLAFVSTGRRPDQEVGEGLGAQAGETTLTEVIRDGGFTRVRRATAGPFNMHGP